MEVTDGNRGSMLVSSLGSGSNGNAFLVETLGSRILIDVGIPIRTLLRCLQQRGIGPSDLSAVLISHEHSDHVRALPQLLGHHKLPVLATRGTHAGLHNVPDGLCQTITPMETLELSDARITPIPVSHDAREPVGFAVETSEASVTILTDVGEVSDITAEFASNCDHLIIESNYDESMLRSGSYPAYLKARIRSNGGHLSNVECATFLGDVVNLRTRSVWLCHLSKNNNRPELAVNESVASLRRRGKVREITALPRYDGTVLTWDSSHRPEVIEQSSFGF